MSRLGKKPIPVPANVKVAVNGRSVQVEGPKGKLQWEHRREVAVKFDDAKKQIVVERMNDERPARAFHGLTWALVKNMVQGVATGYEKRLEIIGVGYQASIKGKAIIIEGTQKIEEKAMTITSEASSKHTTQGAMVNVEASGVNTIKGSLVKIN